MRYVDSVTATALLQALLLTDCPALAQDYSHVCATSSSYTAGAEFDTGTTCDQKMASNTAAGQALAGKDFSSAFDCSSETQTNIDIVDGIAAKCCGSVSGASQRSACYVDFSHVCATPSSYTPDASYNDAKDCDGFMRHVVSGSEALAGRDFSSAFDCSSETQTNIDIVDGIAAKCCGSCGTSTCGGSAGVLSVNYSAAVCKDKSSCACRVAVVMSFISHNYSPT